MRGLEGADGDHEGANAAYGGASAEPASARTLAAQRTQSPGAPEQIHTNGTGARLSGINAHHASAEAAGVKAGLRGASVQSLTARGLSFKA